MANRQEQHWNKLFGHLTTKDHCRYGLCTVYSPSKEVINSFNGFRIFRANQDKTVITHTNKFTYPDGNKVEKQWQIEKNTCNQPDGLIHPAQSFSSGLSLLGNGINAWVQKKIELDRRFGLELFLKHETWNNSVGSIYGENGCLEKILHIREHVDSFPDLEGPVIEKISGSWSGKTEYMTLDLKVSPAESNQLLVLDPTEGKNETFFLTDNVVLNVPKTLKVGEEFEVVAGKLVSNSVYQRLTAKYDNSGNFMMLVAEVFRLETDRS